MLFSERKTSKSVTGPSLRTLLVSEKLTECMVSYLSLDQSAPLTLWALPQLVLLLSLDSRSGSNVHSPHPVVYLSALSYRSPLSFLGAPSSANLLCQRLS